MRKRKVTPSEMADYCYNRSFKAGFKKPENLDASVWWLDRAHEWRIIAQYLFHKLGIFA